MYFSVLSVSIVLWMNKFSLEIKGIILGKCKYTVLEGWYAVYPQLIPYKSLAIHDTHKLQMFRPNFLNSYYILCKQSIDPHIFY